MPLFFLSLLVLTGCNEDNYIISKNRPGEEDLRFPASDLTIAGVSDPGLDPVNIGYDFDDSRSEYLYILAQLPHSRKDDSDLNLHWHWSPQTTNPGIVTWCINYTYANIGSTYTNWIERCVNDTSDEIINKHQITPYITINGTGMAYSGMFKARIYRDGAAAGDNMTGDALLLEFDIHYIADKFGSEI